MKRFHASTLRAGILAFAAVSVFVSACVCVSVPAQAQPFAHPDGTTHWYEAVPAPAGIDWSAAHAAAAAQGGYLATATSGAENTFVFTLVDSPGFWTQVGGDLLGPWLGAVQPPNSTEPAGGWRWAELEAFLFTNWSPGEPDDGGGADRICFGRSTTTRVAFWADAPAATRLRGYVIEYSGALVPRTVGLQRDAAGSFPGYTLFNPWQAQATFLVDARGRLVHRWQSTHEAGVAAYLRPNGDLLRAGRVLPTSFPTSGFGGIVECFDWQGNRRWSFTHSSTAFCAHHDIEPLPNGNVFLVVWERKTRAEAIQAGRDPSRLADNELWPDAVVEIKPNTTGGGATVVWEWHAWDHLVQDHDATQANFGRVDLHPEWIDINFMRAGTADWLHVNAIDYHVGLDQILLSVPFFGEVWVIDHSTTTAQARGHAGGRSGKGGDLLYRWGNPQAYRAGTVADRRLFFHHDAHWIPPGLPGAGRILLFNNGNGRPVPFSSVDEIVPPAVDAQGNYPRPGPAWGPAAPVWSYTANGFFAPFMSGAQRLPSGNTLVCDGPTGRFFEIDPTRAVVWEYTNPVSFGIPLHQGSPVQGTEVFRARRFAPGDPALAGRTLTPIGPLEAHDTVLLVEGSTAPCQVRVGDAVALELRTPAAQAGRFYQVVTSLGSGLIPVDHRFVRQAVDPLLFATLANATPAVFQGYLGILDGAGDGRAAIAVPALPALAGLHLHSTFVVVDAAAPSSLNFLSNTVVVRIGP